jgi:putative ABC transport system permease protein
MFKVSLKGLLAHKTRLLLTALAVIMATAFLSSTYIFSDTIQSTFDTLFADAFKNTDAYVRSSNVIEADFGNKQRDRMPDTVIAEVQAVSGVSDAQGDVQGFASIIGKDGKPLISGNTGAPTFGSVALTGELATWEYVEGGIPSGPDQVAIDKGSADKGNFALGDTIQIAGATGAREFTLAGIARFGNADSPGGASFSLFDLPTAQEFVAKPGFVDAVEVRGDGSVDDAELARRISDQLGPESETEVLTGAEITKENQTEIQDNLKFFTIFLNVVAFIALFVSCFVIYNVFSITVAQRKRENALMRAIGASRRQVTVSLLIESVVVGLVGSILGLFLGMLLALGLRKAFAALGLDLPATGLTLLPRTIVLTIVVGLLVTVFSALLPALRSGRVPPVAAMRDTALETSSATRGRTITGTVLAAVSIVLILLGLFAGAPLLLAPGVLLLFIALFVLGPLIARPVAKLLGKPIIKIKGMTGTMAVENTARNPKRTARTAAALIVGVALVTGVSVLASSISDSVRQIFGDQFRGDFAISVDNFGFGGLSPQLADDLNTLPEVDTATGIGVNYALIDGKGRTITVVDPATVGPVFDLRFVEGSVSDLTPAGVLLSKGKAESDNLTIGSPFPVTLTDGTTKDLTVQGIYTEDDLAGPITVDRRLFDGTTVDQYDFGVFILKADGVSEADAEAAIASVAKNYPNGKLQSRTDYIDSQASGIQQVVNIIYLLLALSVIIAAVGIVITLVLSVFERRRELGLVRAVGMTRSQVRSSVRWESVITAVLGTVQGIVVGLLLGYAIVVALRSQGLNSFTIPWTAIIVVIVLAFALGVVAAIYPAYKATKVDILDAIATT